MATGRPPGTIMQLAVHLAPSIGGGSGGRSGIPVGPRPTAFPGHMTPRSTASKLVVTLLETVWAKEPSAVEPAGVDSDVCV